MDPRTLAGLLVAGSAAALTTNLFTDTYLPLVVGIALAGAAAGAVVRGQKGARGAARVLPILGVVTALAAYSMFRVAMKGLDLDSFDLHLFLKSLRLLAFVPAVALLGGALATFLASDAAARAGLALGVGLALASSALAVAALGDAQLPAFLRPGGLDVVALAGFVSAGAAGAWTAWRHREGDVPVAAFQLA